MKTLREMLGCTPLVKAKPLTEHQQLAMRNVRSMTILDYEAYDIWCVAEIMLEMSLNPEEYPLLFPPNQRKLPRKYPSV